MEQKNTENEDMILHLKEELEAKNNAICEVNFNLTKKCEVVASLMKKVELFDNMKQHQLDIEELLSQSSRKQALLEEKIWALENSQNQDSKGRFEVLSQKIVELEKEKLFVERRNMQLETENQSLLCRVNELYEKNVDLQEQVVLLERLIAERTEAQKKEKEKHLEIVEEKESSIKSLTKVIEEKNQKIEELVKEMTNALMVSEEKQKLEDEFSGLCEKLKVKEESLLKSIQRAEELEELLRINRLENENLMDGKTCLVNRVDNLEAQNQVLYKEKQKLEDELSGLCEKVEVKDESLLKSTQRAEELGHLLQINKLQTENLMDEKMRLVKQVNNLEAQNQVLDEEKHRLEDEFSGLCENVKVKDESLLKSTKRAEELEDLLQSSKLDMKNLMDEKTCLVNQVSYLEAQNQVLYEEKRKLEDEFSCLCEKVKVKDKSLLKSTQQAKELEHLLQINKLETKNLMDEKMRLVNQVNNLEAQNQVLYEEKHKLEDEFASFCEKVKVKDESLLKSTQRAEELEDLQRINKLEIENLMDEKTHLVNQVNNLEAQNQVLYEEKQKLEDEYSDFCKKVKVQDESLLKSVQQAQELEDLLQINKSETKNLMDEKTRLVNQVNDLEAQNEGLHEDIKKILSHKDDLLIQMKTASEQMEEYFKDVEITGMLEKMLQKC